MEPDCQEKTAPTKPLYKIKVQGVVDDSWSDWFSGVEIQSEIANYGDQYSIIRGRFRDQATLRGVMNKLWDLNATLVAVYRINDPGDDHIDENGGN